MFTERSVDTLLVDYRAAEAPGPDRLTRKLRSFSSLPHGWNHGQGVPVDPRAIRTAESFLNAAATLQLKADVFPGISGECAVEFYSGEKSVEIVVRPDDSKTFGLHVECGQGFSFSTPVENENAPLAEVLNQIRSLVPDAWKSSASYRSVSTHHTKGDSPTWSSSSRLVTV